MTATQADILSPPPGLGRTRYRQVARVIVQLRDQYFKRPGRLAMPTTWMVECLVFNCPAPYFDGDDWQPIIQRVLGHIVKATADPMEATRFFQTDGITPLFPNIELFDELDAYYFASAMLTRLEQETLSA